MRASGETKYHHNAASLQIYHSVSYRVLSGARKRLQTDFSSLTLSFNDADEASAFLSTSYAPVKLEPSSRGSFDLTVSATLLAGLQIYRSDTRDGVHFASTGFFDGFTVSSMRRGSTRVTVGAGDRKIGRDQGLIVDAETVSQLSISRQAEFCSVAISADEIQAHLRDRLAEDVDSRIRFDLATPSPQFFSACRVLCDVIHTGLRPEGPLTTNAIALSRLQERLVNLVLLSSAHNYSERLGRDSGFPPNVLANAVDYMHANAHLPINPTDVAKAIGIGLRSLQLSFQRSLETTPYHYLRHVRLSRARDDLMDGSGQPVAVVAHRWGFPWSGEFARLYLQTFGERPLETSRRYRRSG